MTYTVSSGALNSTPTPTWVAINCKNQHFKGFMLLLDEYTAHFLCIIVYSWSSKMAVRYRHWGYRLLQYKLTPVFKNLDGTMLGDRTQAVAWFL